MIFDKKKIFVADVTGFVKVPVSRFTCPGIHRGIRL